MEIEKYIRCILSGRHHPRTAKVLGLYPDCAYSEAGLRHVHIGNRHLFGGGY
jgi:hypothetical protein